MFNLREKHLKSDKPEKLRFSLVSLHFYPIYPGQGTRQPFTRADLLARYGHPVTVITGFPSTPGGSSSKLSTPLAMRETLFSFKMLRLWGPPLPSDGIVNRLLLYLPFVGISFVGLLSLPPTNILYLLDPYPQIFLALPGFFYSKLRGAKSVILVSDLWPEVLIESGAIKSKFVGRIMNGVVKSSLKLTDKVITITDKLKDELVKKGIPANKISVVELAIDTAVFKPKIVSPDKRFLSKFVVMYSGIFGPAYDFDTLLEMAKELGKHPDILMVIRGDGERKREITSKLQNLKLNNTILIGPVDSLEEVVNCLNSADVFVVPMMKGDLVSGSTHPSKILEFMSIEKPVVCAATGEITKLINLSKAGLVVPPGDAKALAASILHLKSSAEERKLMGENGRVYVSENFSYDAIYKKMMAAVA